MTTLVPVEPADTEHDLFAAALAHLPTPLIARLADETTRFYEVLGPEGDLVGVEVRLGDPLEAVYRFEPPLACTIVMDAAGAFAAYRDTTLIAFGTPDELDRLERQVCN